MKTRILDLAQAALRSGIPQEEIETAVRDGLLVAVRLGNTGLFHLEEAELERYLRATRKMELSDRDPVRRILIIDDDVRYAETLRLHLEQDGRLAVRLVSWGRDAVALLHEYKPHLALLGWREADLRRDLVVGVLGLRTLKKQTRVLAYGGNTTRALLGEGADTGLEALGIPGLLSKARGQGELVQACYPALLLEASHAP